MKAETWQTMTFQAMIEAGLLEIGDGYRAKNEELGGDCPMFLRAGHVTDTRIDFSRVERFRAELTDQVRPKMAQHGDTIVTTKGNSTGRTSYVTNRMPPFVYSPHLSYWRSLDHKRVVPGFLRYWARGREFSEQLGGMKASTDMAPYLSLTDQRRLRICLPTLVEQRVIAEILSSLDDKIELNRQTNETLEGMARAIFKSWFVDFEPVLAKAAGHQPVGMDADTAALFPDHFKDSPLGKVPKGWEAGSLLDHACLLSGGTPKTDEPDYWGGRVPWASAKDVSQCGETFLISTERTITEQGLENSSTQIIDANSTVIVARGTTTGRMAMFGMPIAMNQTCYALWSKEGSHFFLYCQARHVIGDLVHSAHGSVFDTITTRTFETTPVLVPDPAATAAFDRVVQPLFLQILARQKEAASLAVARDALLPKLLSGELRVNDAEKLVEAVP